ncbi:unnamed protein product [Cunninghamella blakesleeana]
MKSVARKHQLYDQAYLNTEVVNVKWLNDIQQWQIDYRTGGAEAEIKTEYFNIVFCGVGPLRIPHIPKEYENFNGIIVHTGYWDTSIDFKDKKVAVVGNGASAVQLIPYLQSVTKHLYSYQRTATWVATRIQLKYHTFFKILFRWFPFLMRLHRISLYLIHETTFPLFQKSDSYFAKFVRAWFARDMRKRLERKGRADLVPMLIPKYAPGCKRIARTEYYLEALAESNVTVKMGNITSVDGRTIQHEDGSSADVDILVLATGFNVSGFLGNMNVIGRDNQNLNDLWSGGNYPETYKTMTINGFPNFFLLLGPNSGLGHNSVILMIEQQVNYAVNCMKYMMRNNVSALEPKLESQKKSVDKIQKDLQGTTWQSGGCGSYYKKDGKVFALWSSTVFSYWRYMGFNSKDFIQYHDD